MVKPQRTIRASSRYIWSADTGKKKKTRTKTSRSWTTEKTTEEEQVYLCDIGAIVSLGVWATDSLGVWATVSLGDSTTVSLGDWATVSLGDWATKSLVGECATVSLGDWAIASQGDLATVSLGDWAIVTLGTKFNQEVKRWLNQNDLISLLKDIDGNLASNDDNKQIAELLLRRTDAINRRERLIKAVENAIKLRYQPQIPEKISALNKAKKSRFIDLQQQNSSIGRFLILMSALQDENQILTNLDLEEKKRAIDEKIIHNKNLRDKQIENGEDVEEDHATACQELLRERSDLKMKIEAQSQNC